MLFHTSNTQLIFDDVSNKKKQYDLIKHFYYNNSCKMAEKQEKILIKEMNNKNSTDNSIKE